MQKPVDLLPLAFGNSFTINKVNWSDFKGNVDEKMQWSAHVYWNIDYEILDHEKRKIKVKLNIGERSWVRQEKKCDHLLNHEVGHYLIGGLCALEFLRRLDYKKDSQQTFEDLVLTTFNRTMGQYLQLQKKYDHETQHRLNFKKQQEWDQLIYQKLTYYKKIYDKKKNRFVKLSESPAKNK